MFTLELVVNLLPERTATEFSREHQPEIFEENIGTGGLAP